MWFYYIITRSHSQTNVQICIHNANLLILELVSFDFGSFITHADVVVGVSNVAWVVRLATLCICGYVSIYKGKGQGTCYGAAYMSQTHD